LRLGYARNSAPPRQRRLFIPYFPFPLRIDTPASDH
jgi:hypothetical protein